MTFTGRTAGTDQPRTTPGRRDPAIGALLGSVVGAVVCWLMQRAFGDDALITVSYARTLAESGTWGVFPGITANTQTSPLNAWLLAAGMVVVDQPLLVACGFAVVCLAACGWLAVELARRVDVAPAGGWLAVCRHRNLARAHRDDRPRGLSGRRGTAGDRTGGARRPRGGHRGAVRPGGSDPARPGSPRCRPRARAARGADHAAPTVRGAQCSSSVWLPLVALPWHVWSWFNLGGAVPDTTWVRTGDRSGPTILPAVLAWLRTFARRDRRQRAPGCARPRGGRRRGPAAASALGGRGAVARGSRLGASG